MILEPDFAAAIDKDPFRDHEVTLLAWADALAERNDPAAPGMLWLGVRDKWPGRIGVEWHWWTAYLGTGYEPSRRRLPLRYSDHIAGWYAAHATASRAVQAAALALVEAFPDGRIDAG